MHNKRILKGSSSFRYSTSIIQLDRRPRELRLIIFSQPTMLENFSRTVRNYVPTSIPVPTAAPSPPRVSRPISFGSFMGANLGPSNSLATGRNIPASDRHRRRATEYQPSSRVKEAPDGETTVFGSEDEGVLPENLRLTAYPTVGEGDTILWSRWDTLTQRNSKPRYEPPFHAVQKTCVY